MAKAITQIKKEVPNQELEQSQAVSEIIQELAANKEAILQTISIIKGLHETKVLEAVTSMIEQRTEIGAIAIQQINQPSMHNVIKNGMSAFSFLGSLQPEQLNTLLDGFGHGVKNLSNTEQDAEKQSLWKLRKRLGSPEIRIAMTTMFDFMDGMGEALLRNKRGNS
ncbi:DUF1641 domain-containing protein [Peribacillus sp. Hz7]|uniref:DUF1641 domain-containing protein n=1 Tax=Peribacillus TaxID=2675229 RepID=UPI0035C95CF9